MSSDASNIYRETSDASGIVERPCTCHPDDMPRAPCAKKYALKDCRFASLIDAVRIYTYAREAYPAKGWETRIEDAGWNVAEAYRQYRKSE